MLVIALEDIYSVNIQDFVSYGPDDSGSTNLREIVLLPRFSSIPADMFSSSVKSSMSLCPHLLAISPNMTRLSMSFYTNDDSATNKSKGARKNFPIIF